MEAYSLQPLGESSLSEASDNSVDSGLSNPFGSHNEDESMSHQSHPEEDEATVRARVKTTSL